MSEREPLGVEEKKLAQAILRGMESDRAGNPRSGCIHCAGVHDVVDGLPQHRQPCPRVKRAVWGADDTLLEVEYWRHGQWDQSKVIFPDEAFEEDEESDRD